MIPAILIDMHYMVYRSHHIEQITSAFTKQQWIKIKTQQLYQEEPSQVDYGDCATNNDENDENKNNDENDDREHLRRRRLLRRRRILQPIPPNVQ
jgi:hypothetical protein